ncbi:MAG: DNA-binding protein WhiA [Lachnospiraceae bacterium]
MSFSSHVKEELSHRISSARHCQLAELAAITALNGEVFVDDCGDYSIRISTENENVLRKYFTLLRKTFNIEAENFIDISTNVFLLNDSYEAKRILSALKMIDEEGKVLRVSLVNQLIVQQACCKRSFIRGAFLATGSISDPNKSYHLEIVCTTERKAKHLVEIIEAFGIEARIVQRKKYHVVYIKEGSGIVDMLNVMEAHVALMELENVRILKEISNSVNRQVNCETANLNKTINAAVKQINDIRYIQDTIGLERLEPNLRELAYLRLENTDMNLKDLGLLLSNPIGKSGVNHRLRKLSSIADEIRGNRED